VAVPPEGLDYMTWAVVLGSRPLQNEGQTLAQFAPAGKMIGSKNR
jgi:hypothetical protein